jgi:hypothetical protein
MKWIENERSRDGRRGSEVTGRKSRYDKAWLCRAMRITLLAGFSKSGAHFLVHRVPSCIHPPRNSAKTSQVKDFGLAGVVKLLRPSSAYLDALVLARARRDRRPLTNSRSQSSLKSASYRKRLGNIFRSAGGPPDRGFRREERVCVRWLTRCG